jgi:hypothetical protein
MIASLGPHIGHGYVPGLGKGEVFASDKPSFLTIQINKTGIRYYVSRNRVEFRSH